MKKEDAQYLVSLLRAYVEAHGGGEQGGSDNNLTDVLKEKYDISYLHSQKEHAPVNAEENVQSDWNMADTTDDAFIRNKPIVPTKTSQLVNDMGFLTIIDVDTSQNHVHNNINTLNKISDSKIESWDNKSDFSGSYNDLTSRPSIPFRTSQLVNDSGYITNVDIDTSQNHVHSNKTVLDTITSIRVATWDAKSNFSGDYNDLINKPIIPPIKDLITEEQLNNKLDTKADKADIHTHTNKNTLDDITTLQIDSWNNKSDFSGNYEDLNNKPNIPRSTSELLNDSGFMTNADIEVSQGHVHNNISVLDSITGVTKNNYDISYLHSQQPHAPNDAQKNSDITKYEIESKLIGEIDTHTHSFEHLGVAPLYHEHPYLSLNGGTINGTLSIAESLLSNSVYVDTILLRQANQGIYAFDNSMKTINLLMYDGINNMSSIGDSRLLTSIKSVDNPVVNVNGTSYRIYHEGFKPSGIDGGTSGISKEYVDNADVNLDMKIDMLDKDIIKSIDYNEGIDLSIDYNIYNEIADMKSEIITLNNKLNNIDLESKNIVNAIGKDIWIGTVEQFNNAVIKDSNTIYIIK